MAVIFNVLRIYCNNVKSSSYNYFLEHHNSFYFVFKEMDMNHPAIQAGNVALGAFFTECEKYSWLGEATNLVHLDAIDAQLVPIAEGTGMQLTVIKVS